MGNFIFASVSASQRSVRGWGEEVQVEQMKNICEERSTNVHKSYILGTQDLLTAISIRQKTKNHKQLRVVQHLLHQ